MALIRDRSSRCPRKLRYMHAHPSVVDLAGCLGANSTTNHIKLTISRRTTGTISDGVPLWSRKLAASIASLIVLRT